MLYINTKATCYNGKNAFQILSIIQADMQHSKMNFQVFLTVQYTADKCVMSIF